MLAPALAACLGGADLAVLATLDGASAYESAVLAYVRKNVGGRHEIDNTGSLTATFGSGKPHTLLIAGLDEPGYVVSAITEDGYLRVHRLSQNPPHHNFENFFLAQPVRVTTSGGKTVNGVVAALSVHLQSERSSTVRIDHPEEFYVDIGARSRREVRQADVDLLDPITLEKSLTELGSAGRVSAPLISGRAGAAVLIELGRRLAGAPQGTLTLAFVSQQYSGHRGLARVAERVAADRVVWIKPGGIAKPAVAPASDLKPGMADELVAMARQRKIDVERDTAERLVVPAFATEELWKDPARVATLTLGVENAGTPVEVVSRGTLAKISDLLAEFVGIAGRRAAPASPAPTDGQARMPVPTLPVGTLEALIEVYGVSGREGAVRQTIEKLLPEWARRAARVDKKGNLIVELGSPPERLFISHMDELGYEITEVEADGRLRAETRGGGTTEFFEWHAGLVHTESSSWPAILLGGGFGGRARVDIGATDAEKISAMSVKAGDTFTLAKRFRPLLGRRANARSFVDRIGCAVMVDTLRSLKREEIRRPTWFVFAVEEEVGLRGAEFIAGSVRPREVYPLDTFVSSDSPVENPRMAGARLGEGFVIRAIDSSGITPRWAVARVVELARKHSIPVQYGVTSGANDGSKFVAGGAINIPLGWPLRYSHSPAEMVDLADVEALARIMRVLATENLLLPDDSQSGR